MRINGRNYYWVPHNGAILLTAWPNQFDEHLGRIRRTASKVELELTAQAISAGLFEVAVVATLLLQSGMLVQVGKNSAYILNLGFCSAETFNRFYVPKYI